MAVKSSNKVCTNVRPVGAKDASVLRNTKRIMKASSSCKHKYAIALDKSAHTWALMMSKVLLPLIILHREEYKSYN